MSYYDKDEMPAEFNNGFDFGYETGFDDGFEEAGGILLDEFADESDRFF